MSWFKYETFERGKKLTSKEYDSNGKLKSEQDFTVQAEDTKNAISIDVQNEKVVDKDKKNKKVIQDKK